jgi:hypothetical protein
LASAQCSQSGIHIGTEVRRYREVRNDGSWPAVVVNQARLRNILARRGLIGICQYVIIAEDVLTA